MEAKIRIIICERHRQVRELYAHYLECCANCEIIGLAETPGEAIEKFKGSKPDILLMDTETPLWKSLHTLQALLKVFPEVKPIVISSFFTYEQAGQIVSYGARACLPRAGEISELLEAIRQVLAKGSYLDNRLLGMVLNAFHRSGELRSKLRQIELTERERDVLRLICESRSNDQIADDLSISVRTVEFHREKLFRKTNSKSIVDLVKYAIRNGIVSVE